MMECKQSVARVTRSSGALLALLFLSTAAAQTIYRTPTQPILGRLCNVQPSQGQSLVFSVASGCWTPGAVTVIAGAPGTWPSFAAVATSGLKADVGLGNVEDTALSTWTGSINLASVGTIVTGVWHGTAIGDTYISSAAAWNAKVDYTGATADLNLGTHALIAGSIQTGDGTKSSAIILPEEAANGTNNQRIYGAKSQSADGCIVWPTGTPSAGQVPMDSNTTESTDEPDGSHKTCRVFTWQTPGNVVGPGSATDNHLAVYDGTTGKLVKDGGAIPTGNVVGPGSATDNHLAVFDGATGKLVKDGGAIPGGGGNLILTVGMTSGTSQVAGATTSYLGLSGIVTILAAEANVRTTFHRAGTFKNFCATTYGGLAQPADGALVLTIRKNGTTDTALVVTIAANEAGGAEYCDTTHTAAITDGDYFTVKAANAGSTASAAIVGLYVEVQ